MIDNLIQFIARLLSGIYGLPVVGGSYGVAIIILTIFIMIMVMPLTLKATKSTIRMSMVAPELKRIQKEFKEDKEQMNTEMMELYREHGINPVGGCLPVLAQAPVFLVLFQVIRGLTRRVQDAPFSDVVYKVYDFQGRAAEAHRPQFVLSPLSRHDLGDVQGPDRREGDDIPSSLRPGRSAQRDSVRQHPEVDSVSGRYRVPGGDIVVPAEADHRSALTERRR